MKLSTRRVAIAAALLVAVAAAVAVAGASASSSRQAASAKVAIIETGPALVGSYNTTHTLAFNAMCKQYKFTCKVVDNVAYANTDQTLTRLAAAGMNLIIANSNGFANGLLDIAPKFPNTWFVMTSDIPGTKGNKNLAGFVQDWQQFGFLGGVVAGYLSKTGVMGYVVGQPLTAAKRMMGGALQGVRYVNPKARVIFKYTNSWVDTSLAKQAALAEVASGADVVTAVDGGGNPGVIQAAQEKKLKYLGYLADEYKSAPCCIPTSMTIDAKHIYQQIGQLYSTKQLKPKLYVGGVGDGSIKLAPLRGVPKAIAAKILAVQAKVKSGQIKVKETLYG